MTPPYTLYTQKKTWVLQDTTARLNMDTSQVEKHKSELPIIQNFQQH